MTKMIMRKIRNIWCLRMQYLEMIEMISWVTTGVPLFHVSYSSSITCQYLIFLEKEMEDLIEDIVPSERLVELAKNLSPPLRQTEPTKTATAGMLLYLIDYD